jgi:hypothetical protein
MRDSTNLLGDHLSDTGSQAQGFMGAPVGRTA